MSDWSSDVFSSDLINSRDTATADPIANLARHWEAEVPALVRRIRRDGITPLPAQAAQAPAMLLARGDASQAVFEKTGRASCRDRVCQRVGLGWRRIFKTQKLHINSLINIAQ